MDLGTSFWEHTIQLETKIDMLEAELKLLKEVIERYERRFSYQGKIQSPPNPKSIRIWFFDLKIKFPI